MLNTPYESEQDVVAAILGLFKNRPDACVWRNNTGRKGGVRFGLTGSPDVLGVVAGVSIAIEAKHGKYSKQSEDQKAFQQRWERAGGRYVLARSARDVLEALGI